MKQMILSLTFVVRERAVQLQAWSLPVRSAAEQSPWAPRREACVSWDTPAAINETSPLGKVCSLLPKGGVIF